MSNQAEIKRAFERIGFAFKKEKEKNFDKLIFRFLNGVIQKTPVDTGRARAGWRYTKDSKTEATVYNPVHYIVYLEHGHSKQAPHGMVRLTMQEIRRSQFS